MDCQIEFDDIYKELVRISGPWKDLSATTKERSGYDIYGSYHFQQFNKTNAQRDTLRRFYEYKIDVLNGKRVFDMGSNLGSLSFEALRRCADSVLGFEYSNERVAICNRLNKALGTNGTFIQMDISNNLDSAKFISRYGTADIVFCCALDAYIENKKGLYKLIADITLDTCFFETNSRIKNAEFIEIMKLNGFGLVIELGMSKSDVGHGRNSYIMIKSPNLFLEKIRPKQNSRYNHKIYKWNNNYIYEYFDNGMFAKMKKLYSKIKHLKNVAKIDFHNNITVIPNYERQLSCSKFSKEEKQDIKKQLIEFIKELNENGIAHRDLHIGNAFYHKGVLIIIDWECIELNNTDIVQCYDLTGNGLESPLYSGHMNVFCDHKSSFLNFLDLGITINDFL